MRADRSCTKESIPSLGVARAHHWCTQGFSHPVVSFQPHTGVVDQNEGKL